MASRLIGAAGARASWRPFTFYAGPHMIRVLEPESGRSKELPAVAEQAGDTQELEVML